MYHGPDLPPTKPCPFCGDATSLSEVDEVFRVRWQVQCDDDSRCGTRGPMADDAAEAVRAWNAPGDVAQRPDGSYVVTRPAISYPLPSARDVEAKRRFDELTRED